MSITLQRCSECGTTNYPTRQVCRHCLSDKLTVVEESGAGKLLAVSTLHRSLEPAYAELLPLRIGTVKLDCGPQVICFVAEGVNAGDQVRLQTQENPLGQPTWHASAA